MMVLLLLLLLVLERGWLNATLGDIKAFVLLSDVG